MLAYIATSIYLHDQNTCLSDKCQMLMVIRRKISTGLTFVGYEEITLDALIKLLWYCTHWYNYTEILLIIDTVNKTNEKIIIIYVISQ